MFVVFLKFSDNKDKAGEFMDAHNAWIMSTEILEITPAKTDDRLQFLCE